MSAPTPAIMPKVKSAVALAAHIDPEHDARLVRPGTRDVLTYDTHDGVVKAKHLKPGMTVRAFLHGRPCGGERVVESVERIDDGAMVRVAFSSPHPATEYKAAYRFYVEELAGQPIPKTVQVPALVPYEEV